MVVRAYPARMASAAPLIDCLVVRLTLFVVNTPFLSLRALVQCFLPHGCMLSGVNTAVSAADARSIQPMSSYLGSRMTTGIGRSVRSSSVAVRAIMGRVEPAIVTLTSGLAWRLRYQAGCRSSPLYEATSTTRSSSAIDAASIVERSLPDLRPVVTSSTTGIPKALLKIRPFETLKSARWMRVATLYNASLDLMRIGPVP